MVRGRTEQSIVQDKGSRSGNEGCMFVIVCYEAGFPGPG